jgi:NADH-quinone oxidoreductase subunit L
MWFIVFVGAATALFAALVSMTQSDIKKILAYSTISQIGFMIMMCGVGAFGAAVFHLLAHGFLKAFLFLSTGDALRALKPHRPHGAEAHGDGDPAKSWLLPAGALLFACIPPVLLFSGPYEAMWSYQGLPQATITFWVVALATVFLTAAYMTRATESRFQRGFPLSGRMVRPRFFSVPHVLIAGAWALVLLAVLLAVPAWFTGFIAPALPAVDPSLAAPGQRPLVWLVLPVLAAIAGWLFAVATRATHSPHAERSAGWINRAYVLFWNKLYFDEIYDAYIVAPVLRAARGLEKRVEHAIVERGLTGVASISVGSALWLWQILEGRGMNRAVSGTATASMSTARWLWRVLEGRGFQGGNEQLSQRADALGRYLEDQVVHTLQDLLLLVVGGLAAMLVLFYLVIHSFE